MRTLNDLRKRREAGELTFERVIIETTGMANPGPVCQTFFMDDDISEYYRLDAVVTIVDAKHGIGASKLRAARIDIETEFSQPMRIALRSMHVKYENLVGRLTSEVDNQDFWQAGSAT